MRVLIFQPRFAQLVLSGAKTQTIRKAARCKPGDALSLREWTGRPRLGVDPWNVASARSVARGRLGTGVVAVEPRLGGRALGEGD